MANPALPYEASFQAFLHGRDIGFEVEPDRLAFEAQQRCRINGRAMRPDLRLNESLSGLTVYLELTEADRFVSAKQLPLRVRQRNAKKAASGRGYISPAEYLFRKRARIRLAEAANPDCAIVLLDYATQQAIYQRPALLDELIASACHRRSSLALAS